MFSMTKFAKGNNSKNKITFFLFSPGYLLVIFDQLTLKLLAVIFLRYLDYKFPMPKFAKGNNSKKKKINFSSGYLLIIFYQLTKFEATCCKSFWDILITSFQCQKFAKGNNSKKHFFLNFHQIIYSLSTITWSSLKLMAVILFEISNFLCPNVQRAITQNKITFFFNVHQVINSLCSISWPSLKLIAVLVFEILSLWPFKRGITPDLTKYVSIIFLLGIHIWNFKTVS